MAIWDLKERNNLVRKNTASRGAQLGLFAGGATPSNVGVVDRINVNNRGDATDFGDLVRGNQCGCGFGSSTRGIQYAGEDQVNYLNNIDYINWASQGNFSDFGDSTQPGGFRAGHSNNIRGVSFGTYTPVIASPYVSNTIDFITIGSLGNATDFGDLTAARMGPKGAGSTTRAYSMAGSGNNGFTDYGTHCDTVLIATTGNATDYGDMATGTNEGAAFSSNVRGVHAGGRISGAYTNVIQLIALATTGTGSDFGDLSAAKRRTDGLDNSIRGIVAGGLAPGNTNVIESVEIATTGNATDFGDLTSARHHPCGIDSSHGGIDFDEIQRPSVTYMPGSGRGFTNAGTNSGGSGGSIDRIQLTHIPTLGNAIDFGNAVARQLVGGVSSLTRTVIMGGEDPDAVIDTIDSFEHSSLGNTADFGNLSAVRRNMSGGGGNSTRGVFAGGNTPSLVDIIEYITFASAGDATDFGNLSAAREGVATCSGGTRTVHGGGYASGEVNTIEYTTTASTGNATDFGDLTDARRATPASSPVRAVFMGGYSPGRINIIDYITIASTGDAADFGDLTIARSAGSGLSNSTRAIHSGGEISGGDTVNQDYITIATTGDAADFGDLVEASQYHSGTSDSHGGLQGQKRLINTYIIL